MMALNQTLHVRKLHLRMSPLTKRTPTRLEKESNDKIPSLRPEMIATPSLQSIFYAGLDSKLVKKMVGETTNAAIEVSKPETPPPPAPSIKIPLMEHQKPLSTQWNSSPIVKNTLKSQNYMQKSIGRTNKRKIKEYFTPNHQKASSPYGKVPRLRNKDREIRAKRILVKRYPKSRNMMKKNPEKREATADA